jgi:hypothetical protein
MSPSNIKVKVHLSSMNYLQTTTNKWSNIAKNHNLTPRLFAFEAWEDIWTKILRFLSSRAKSSKIWDNSKSFLWVLYIGILDPLPFFVILNIWNLRVQRFNFNKFWQCLSFFQTILIQKLKKILILFFEVDMEIL